VAIPSPPCLKALRRAQLLLGVLVALSGCTSSIARGKFEDAHGDCDDVSTVRDADGTIIVSG